MAFRRRPEPGMGKTLPAGAVRITLRSGATLHGEASHDETPGASRNPLGWEQLTAKFADCLAHAARPPRAPRDEATAFVVDLENRVDVAELARILG